jgi:hypothetical protein
MAPFQSLFAQPGDPYMPFPKNAPRVDELMSLPPQEIAALPVELLATLQHEIDVALKHDKAVKARLDAALIARYASRAEELRRLHGKDTGTVRFDDGDFTIVADLPKRIAWDQAQLAAMADRIRDARDDPSEYIDIAFKVSERKYTAWPEAIRKGFELARTVKPGTLRIELVSQEADQ